MKKFLGGLSLLLALGTMTACSTSGTSQKSIQNKGKIVIATESEFAPFEFKTLIDGKDTLVGADIELAKAIAKELDVKADFSVMSFNNVLASVTSGKADIAIAGISVTDERKKAYEFSDAYYEAAHKGGYYTRFLYSSLAAKYININICHALKALDNSIYIVEGETEPNGKAVTDDYCASNPAIEVSVLKETKHLPHVEAPEAFLEQVKIFF